MQDSFRFRYYDEKSKKIYDVCFIDFNCPCVSVYLSKEELLHIGKIDFKWENLIQCTGLKDENGNLIYENDIVKTLYTRPDGVVINRNCVVEFNRCAFWINYGIGASYLDNDDCIYEVIGNIYENKELLND